jgi:hypothetical protein
MSPWPGVLLFAEDLWRRSPTKMFFDLEGPHAFRVSIFDGVEHLRADKGARLH